MTWVHVFAGRLESRPSISPGLAYFPIPFPQADNVLRQRLTIAWAGIEAVRAQLADATLVQLYGESTMPSPLRNAHIELDLIVDKAFGAKTLCTSSEERKEILFARYVARITR